MARGSNKRTIWNEKKKKGMSFLLVLAFFAIFALIILTEILMIDDKGRGKSLSLMRGGFNRFGESIPDYDYVKEEYSIEEAILMKDSQLQRQKRKENLRENTFGWRIRLMELQENDCF